MNRKTAVVGGGAAGMMAAYAAALCGSRVTLYEKNEKLGKKIYITGKGRCNVTNACDREELLNSVVNNPRFLYSAFSAFDNKMAQDFFEKEGCPLKTERGGRVFPVSDHASDIIRAMERALRRENVKICLHTGVKKVLIKELPEDGTKKVCGLKLSDGTSVEADEVILATGGLSYPTTGSDGDGFLMAEELGHTVTPLSPSLVPFETAEEWCRSLQGLALKNVELSLYLDGKEIYSEMGEMLFTHFGVSGPLALSASSYYGAAMEKWRRKNEKKGKEKPECRLCLNLKPALDEQQLDKRLLRDFEANKNRNFANSLGGLFPAKLIPVMIMLSGIDPEKKVHEITREERRRFVELIRCLPMTVTGTRGFNEAIITRGGIKVKEVNPSTMESKLIEGLYFAGEMLDVDALTGGFNLQIAWSTGHLAGKSISGEKKEERENGL